MKTIKSIFHLLKKEEKTLFVLLPVLLTLKVEKILIIIIDET